MRIGRILFKVVMGLLTFGILFRFFIKNLIEMEVDLQFILPLDIKYNHAQNPKTR